MALRPRSPVALADESIYSSPACIRFSTYLPLLFSLVFSSLFCGRHIISRRPSGARHTQTRRHLSQGQHCSDGSAAGNALSAVLGHFSVSSCYQRSGFFCKNQAIRAWGNVLAGACCLHTHTHARTHTSFLVSAGFRIRPTRRVSRCVPATSFYALIGPPSFLQRNPWQVWQKVT